MNKRSRGRDGEMRAALGVFRLTGREDSQAIQKKLRGLSDMGAWVRTIQKQKSFSFLSSEAPRQCSDQCSKPRVCECSRLVVYLSVAKHR